MQIIAAWHFFFFFFLVVRPLLVCSLYRLRQLMRIKDFMLFRTVLLAFFYSDGLTVVQRLQYVRTHTHIISNHNRHKFIRAEDTLHSPLCNLLFAYVLRTKRFPFYSLVFFSFFLVFYFYLFSTHTHTHARTPKISFPFVLFQRCKFQCQQPKMKKNKSSKTGWHESSFSETNEHEQRNKKKHAHTHNKFICHSCCEALCLLVDFTSIEHNRPPFLCALAADQQCATLNTYIFPFCTLLFNFNSFSSVAGIVHISFLHSSHASLLYLLHFVTSFGCMITSNLVSNLKCKFSMVIYTTSTRLSYCSVGLNNRVSKSMYRMCAPKAWRRREEEKKCILRVCDSFNKARAHTHTHNDLAPNGWSWWARNRKKNVS